MTSGFYNVNEDSDLLSVPGCDHLLQHPEDTGARLHLRLANSRELLPSGCSAVLGSLFTTKNHLSLLWFVCCCENTSYVVCVGRAGHPRAQSARGNAGLGGSGRITGS